MIKNLFKGLKEKEQNILTKQQIAEILKTSPEAIQKFEEAYKKEILNLEELDDEYSMNSRQASDYKKKMMDSQDSYYQGDLKIDTSEIVNRIVDEFIPQTIVYSYNPIESFIKNKQLKAIGENKVTLEEVSQLPISLRPDCTGHYLKKDIARDSYPILLFYLNKFLTGKNKKEKQDAYNHFRQGLDIMDIDEISYEIISCNKNSMGHWFGPLVSANDKHKFFKIPETKIAKVPLSMLQLTRQEFMDLSPTTLKIVNEWARKTFDLKPDGDYFIKTGTYSSKFDFRNCRVNDEKEISELGEYLLFIHFQALQMASPLSRPSIYGVSTTTEWVVREYIKDKENNPCIYKGLPLHTEYRVFVDCDKKKVFGVHPYWDPEVMKKRFSQNNNDMDMVHDSLIYQTHENILMKRFEENKDTVLKNIENLVKDLNLEGQWSIDVMQNGDDFWLIDMALAENSAFYKDVISLEDRNPLKENWLPKIS